MTSIPSSEKTGAVRGEILHALTIKPVKKPIFIATYSALPSDIIG